MGSAWNLSCFRSPRQGARLCQLCAPCAAEQVRPQSLAINDQQQSLVAAVEPCVVKCSRMLARDIFQQARSVRTARWQQIECCDLAK